jgi:CRISPR-associated protein Cmr2
MLDYYGLQRMRLNDSLSELELATEQRKQAKEQKNREAVKIAERKMTQAAEKAVKIEPHLAYLWFKARDSELDKSIRDAWQKISTISPIPPEFHFLPDTSVVSYMPSLSFMLNIPFRLQKPYLSKDERDFHLLDNPLRREKVFQTPMVAATSWKGALRAALWQLGHKKQDDLVIIRLLGNERESEKQQAGRLYFFPTFFDKIGLEVINPHNRKTGIDARGPILMECVRQGARGDLILLYVPFGLTGQTEEARRADVALDLQVLAKGIRAMLTIYGFGAKTSSGFGMAEDRLAVNGKLAIRAKLDGGTAALTEYQFNGLSELCEELAPRVAELLRKGGGEA